MNFTELKNKIETAAKQAFLEMFQAHGDDQIYAFALYSDEGAMSVCPSTNTLKHFKMQESGDFYYKYAPAEWAFEMQGADELFNEICQLCHNESARLIKLGDEDEFAKYQNQLFETCISVLEKLKTEGFFRQIVGEEIFLHFVVSDYDYNEEDVQNIIIRLNDNEYRDEYFAWTEELINAEIARICNDIVSAIIENDFADLQKSGVFAKFSQELFVEVLRDYMEDSDHSAVTPIPDSAYQDFNRFLVIAYEDGSGWHIDLDLWLDGKQSDLTLQLDIAKDAETGWIGQVLIDDLHVM